MTKKTNIDKDYIDLAKLFKAIMKKLWLVILAVAILASAGYGVSSFVMVPMYKAEIMLYVNNTASSASVEGSISTSELYAAQSLVETYMVILKSEPSLDIIREATGLNYSSNTLSNMIDAEAMTDTEVFKVSVSSAKSQEACDIANAIADMMPDRISGIVEGSSVRVVQYAKVPTSPYSPNIFKYTVLGALAGFILSCLLICIAELSDKRVRSAQMLTERYNIPIIAEIPDLSRPGNNKYGDYAGAYGSKEVR